MTDFIHLHNHSDFSLLDGAAPVKRLAAKAKELGMHHLAITDHGSMFGALRFYQACKDVEINPIIGCEFYVAPKSRHIKSGTENGSRAYHMVLLAMNEVGYKNLIYLDSMAYVEGFYYKPRIDDELLAEYHEGLICTSACLGGEISVHLKNGQLELAEERALFYRDLFGKDNYYLELQDHGIADQKTVNTRMVKLSQDTGIPLVATNDIHYIDQEDANAQDILICIGTNRKKHELGRMKFQTDQFYMKSGDEMAELFKFAPEAIANTLKIAERCNLEINFPGPLLPDFEIPPEFSNPDEYMRHITYEGLKNRYPEITDEIKERSEYELGVIIEMGFTGYFLIVWDFIHWAKQHDIPVGPGRGSGAGSIVAYAMTITDIDPLKYKLLFERFLNPERVSMPDFDIDFCYERRGEVIEYVTQKYGTDRVGQIITFGTLKAKAVLKDVARVLDIPFSETNEISKLIPSDPKMTIAKAMKDEPKLQELEQKGGVYAELFDVSRRLEGLNRHCSTHAAGIVIGKDVLTNYVPLYRDAKTGSISTQYTMDVLEECGLVKMDFLGLKTLTLIKNTVDLVKKRGINIDIDKIPEDDKKTYRMLWDGLSSCIFQFESSGMQGILRDAKPNSIEDLIALNALYRPGPMSNIPKYIASKNGSEPIEYPHKDLEESLKQTYGVIVYQEQVMQVAQTIGGFSLGKADLMRRAMGKKKVADLMAMKEEFIQGAESRGYSKDFANYIFEMLEPFAGYGFNKSHAAAYSVVAYQTAYLKANYPVEFMAANLTNEINSPDKLTLYINETKSMGIDILPPNINLSEQRFNVANEKVVYGLNGIKNVGTAAVDAIISEREANGTFASFMDYLNRVELKVVNKKVLESLIQSGAFDSIGENRSTLMHNLEEVTEYVSKRKAAEQFGQVSLFDIQEEESLGNFQMQSAQDISLPEKLQLEKELLGFYFSGHPMDDFHDLWTRTVRVDLSKPEHLSDKHACNLVGMINTVRTIVTKKGDPMAFCQIEDFNGKIEIILFPKPWAKYRHLMEVDRIIGLTGKIDTSKGEPKFLVDTIVDPNELKQSGVTQIHVKLDKAICTNDNLNSLREAFLEHLGSCALLLHIYDEKSDTNAIIKASGQLNVAFSDDFIDILKRNPLISDVWYL